MKLFRNRSEYTLRKDMKERIEKEIDIFSSLNTGMFIKVKEYELGYYINFIVDKKTIGVDMSLIDKTTANTIPDFITFMAIIDYSYPSLPPKILSKTNFFFPNLMDGRDLSCDILPKWTSHTTLVDISGKLLSFLKTLLTNKSYQTYGRFHLGAIYDLKNMNNMLVNTFNCRFDLSTLDSDDSHKSASLTNDEAEYTIVLSDDLLILFQKLENDPSIGKVVFWASLYSIIDVQINKPLKIVNIHMYSEEKSTEKDLRLHIQNITFFREVLVKKMLNLKVKIEAVQSVKGQFIERRLTTPDINGMNIEQIEENIKLFEKRIEQNELSFYIVNTFSILCGKAIEYYSSIESDKHMEILVLMKKVFARDDVKNIANNNES